MTFQIPFILSLDINKLENMEVVSGNITWAKQSSGRRDNSFRFGLDTGDKFQLMDYSYYDNNTNGATLGTSSWFKINNM